MSEVIAEARVLNKPNVMLQIECVADGQQYNLIRKVGAAKSVFAYMTVEEFDALCELMKEF